MTSQRGCGARGVARRDVTQALCAARRLGTQWPLLVPSVGAAGLGALPRGQQPEHPGRAAPPGLPWGPGRDPPAPLGFIVGFAPRKTIKRRGAGCSASRGARGWAWGLFSPCFTPLPSRAASAKAKAAAVRSPAPSPRGSAFSASGLSARPQPEQFCFQTRAGAEEVSFCPGRLGRRQAQRSPPAVLGRCVLSL